MIGLTGTCSISISQVESPVILGEVGWPSAGKPDNETAVSTVENERIYTNDMIIAVKAGQIRSIFLFEAFNETWKRGNQWEPHWGLCDQNGITKFPIKTAQRGPPLGGFRFGTRTVFRKFRKFKRDECTDSRRAVVVPSLLFS
jgi:hypothetical protein